jgi:transcriptional regulator with XRE-family HTH domain
MGAERAELQELGSFVRRRRQELRLTQTQLGRRIGYYQERISAIECGTYGLPSLPALQSLAGALECELTDLLVACGYMEAKEQGTGPAAAGRNTQVHTGVTQLHQGMDDLQRRLTEVASAVSTIEVLRERMRARRQAMDDSMRQCRKMVS